jgi:hypothetical protein
MAVHAWIDSFALGEARRPCVSGSRMTTVLKKFYFFLLRLLQKDLKFPHHG